MSLHEEIHILSLRIANGIDDAGVCSLHDDELAVLWANRPAITEPEKHQFIEEFAELYGYRVHLSDIASAAIFKYVEAAG